MDRVLRFVYVALIPPILAVLNAVVPVGAIVVTSAIATAVAVFGAARWQAQVSRIPVAGRILRGFARVGAFYDEHPPKPLVYYIAYPLLLPYWLINRTARREFLLYSRISAVALIVTVIGGALEYYRNWYPMLRFGMFVGESIALLLFQLLITFTIVTPIVTTIVVFHHEHHRRSLTALLCVAALTGSIGMAFVHHKQPLSASASMRLQLRMVVARPQGVAALERGLDAAAAALAVHPDDLAGARDRAHDALETFFRPDEVRAFRLYAGDGVTLLYTKPSRGAPSVWLARDAQGRQVSARLPPMARSLVGL